jgi:peptidyl-prolyl cis-trans isomerase C
MFTGGILRIVLLAVLALSACNNPPPADVVTYGVMAGEGPVVMTVDGKPFHQNQLDSILANVPAPQLEQMKAQGQLTQLLDQIAMTNALYEKALADKIHEKADVKLSIALAERQALAQSYVMARAQAAVTPEAVQAWYDQRKVQYAKPEVRARHILVKEESQALEIKAKLDAGGDFAALAKEFSVDQGSAVQGGDLGWFAKDRMVETFAEAAFAAEVNAIVGPVSTRFGFHLIQVQEKRDSVPLDDVRAEAEDAIKTETIRAVTNEIKAAMKVEKMGEYADKTPPPVGDQHGGGNGLPPNHPPPAPEGAPPGTPPAPPAPAAPPTGG